MKDDKKRREQSQARKMQKDKVLKSQLLREQLRSVQREVREAERQQRAVLDKYRSNDAVELVTGLQTRHSLLVISGNSVFPSIADSVGEVTTAPRAKDLDRLIDDNKLFDRIFFERNAVLAEATVIKAVALKAPGGLLCFFSEEDGLRAAFVDCVTSLWPSADVWICDSSIGPVVMTDASGHLSYSN